MLKNKKHSALIICAALIVLIIIAGVIGGTFRSFSFKSSNGYSYNTADEICEEISGFSSSSYNVSDEYTEDTLKSTDSHIIVRHASLNVETNNFHELLKTLCERVEQNGGYIESQNESASGVNGKKSGTLVLRIPADKLDSFISFTGANCVVTYKNISSDDITSDYVDTESKIKSLEVEKQALLNLMEKAESISETIEIQDRLTTVCSDLEYCKSMLKRMDTDVTYSSVSIDIREVNRTGTQGSGFLHEIKEGLLSNLYSIGEGFRYIAIWLITSLPIIAIIALFAIIMIKIVKFGVKRWKTKKSSSSTSEETSQQ